MTLSVFQQGFVDLDPVNSFFAVEGQLRLNLSISEGGSSIGGVQSKDTPNEFFGNYLLRLAPTTAIPEPSTLTLLVFGLIALAGFRRRRRTG